MLQLAKELFLANTRIRIMSSRYIKQNIIKRLFSDTNGSCPECSEPLLRQKTVIGEICHIEAVNPGGARYNRFLDEEKVNDYDNLIVLCPSCHAAIDKKENQDHYTKEFLIDLKYNSKNNLKPKIIELSEQQMQTVEERFAQKLNEELSEIRRIISELNSCICLTPVEEEFSISSKFLPSFDEIKSFNFNTTELDFIENINKEISSGETSNIIVCGAPSSGKTTLVVKLASTLHENFKLRYLDLKLSHSLADIKKDLKTHINFPTIIIVDNGHLDYSMSCNLYKICQLYQNINLVFAIREISEKDRVDNQTGIDLFSISDKVFYVNPNQNNDEKIFSLINRKIEDIFQRTGIRPEIGDFNKVRYFINRSLLKLNILLDFWESEPTTTLDSFDINKLNKIVFKKYFGDFDLSQNRRIMHYTCLNQFEFGFYFSEYDAKTKQDLEKEGLVLQDKEGTYSFFHPSFSKILLSSLIHSDENFKLDFPNGYYQFEKNVFFEYFRFFKENNRIGYPPGFGKILNKIIVHHGYEIFKELTTNKEIKKQILNYFNNNLLPDEFSSFFSNLERYNSKEFDFYQKELVTNNSKISEVLKRTIKDALDLRKYISLFARKNYRAYKRLIESIDEIELKKILFSSQVNDLTFCLRYIHDFDKNFAIRLANFLEPEDWIKVFRNAPVHGISNSIIEISKIKGRKFASQILNEIDFNRKLYQVKKIPISNLTKSLSELKTFNGKIPQLLLQEIDSAYLKNKMTSEPLGKVSKSFKELFPLRKDAVKETVKHLKIEHVINQLEDYNLADTGRILSELYDLDNNGISEYVNNQEFVDLLKQKIIKEEKCGHLAKFLLDLKKINSSFADRLVKAIPQKIFDKVLKVFELRELADLVYVINSLPSNKEKAKEIFENVESRTIIDSVCHNSFRITDFQSIFKQFYKVDYTKTRSILNNIPDDVLIEKATRFGFSARKTSQALNALNSISKDKIVAVCKILFEQIRFKKSMSALSATDLANAYADFLQIDKELTKTKFADFINNIPEEKLIRDDISGFSDGLRRIQRFEKLSKNDKVIQTFEKHLTENISHFRLRQISMCFRNLKHIDDSYSEGLLKRIPIEIMEKKCKEIDSQENLNGSLGELRTVSLDYWNLLTKKIGYVHP
jgi:energy-coupling factor transporter ATP-binding protein EcfA2/5-methylcytosine-specific restriction endonuclease McrA